MANTSSRRLPKRSSEELEEVGDLKQEIEYLQNRLNELLNQEARDDIRPDDYIKVISLCPYTLNLATEMYGRGRVYTFKKFGEVKRIRYQDLVDIIELHRNFLEDGFYAILDESVIRRHGLEDQYTQVLTYENMEKILEGNESDAVNFFKNASKKQQEHIALMYVEKINNGEEVDRNFLDRLSRVIGYSIDEKARNVKEQNEIANNIKK